ncbi:MAG TPA: hypothetical protein VJY43_06575 [Methanocorpusculum sp.]|nr:hypothetical protein [Methanocorpusculum sp.]
MPITALLQSACISESKIIENHVGISVDYNKIKKPLENLLLFHTDGSHEFHDDFLPSLTKKPSPKCCDGLVFYINTENPQYPLTICFIELKGKNVDEAVEQVLDTYDPIRTYLKAAGISESKIKWKAVIISSRGCSQNKDMAVKRLMDKFNRNKEDNVLYNVAKSKTFTITDFITA